MKKKPFPLHPSQKEVYIDQLLNVESPHYNIGGYIKLVGSFDKEKFLHIVHAAPKVFDTYKMRFDPDLSVPSFIIDEDYEHVEVDELDFSGKDNARGIGQDWMQERFNTPFAIKKDNLLFEHVLIKIEDKEYWFFCRYHHLITDGYGFTVWVQYLATQYRSLIAGDNLPVSYPSYVQEAVKATEFYNSPDYELEGEYWKEKIKTKPKKLLSKKYFGHDAGSKSATFILELTGDQKKLFEDLQLLTKVGMQQLTIAALIIYFAKTTNEKEFVFGIPLHKRGSKKLRSIIGMFSGIQPFKGDYNEEEILLDLLKEISQIQRKDYRYQNYLIGDLSRHFATSDFEEGYLTQIVVNYEPLNFENDFGPDVNATVLRLANEYEVTPLQLVWRDYGKNRALQLHIHYKNEYFSAKEIELLAHRLLYILEQFPQELSSKTSSINIIPTAEYQLLESFNNTSSAYPSQKTIVELFEEQALKAPEANAVIFGDQKLSYLELNERANQLASYLKNKGVKEGTCMPICIDRSPELMVGILGILKAGGAYVPIDVDYPAERIKFMLNDVAARFILTSEESRKKLQIVQDVEFIELDKEWSVVAKQSKDNVQAAINPFSLAYIIYTSGSTGTPKGVMVEHGNVVSLVKGVEYVSLTDKDILLSTGSPSFDATTFEYWGMLLNGGQLVLCTENTLLDSQLLKAEISERKVTKMWFTSSWFNQLVETDITVFSGLQTVLVGGEKLSEKHIEKLRQADPSIEIINGYGPTENTTFSITYTIQEKEVNSSIPIGRPLTNRSAYITNYANQLVPIGVPGEILLGGAGLSKGYLNRPELTEERFVTNPFDDNTQRLYKTGDLGRWRSDGNIEYLGRIDDQVKIRGYRIELGEIESVLLQSEQVSQAVVLAKEDSNGTKRLVGYVVAETAFDKHAISAFLLERLPEYMVPALWVELHSLPLTSNGKVDKQALPEPDATKLTVNGYVAPATEFQRALAEIWQQLLGVERVGIEDNFFELGGDSILTIQVVSRTNRLGYHLQPKDIFVHQTIARITRAIADRSAIAVKSEQGELTGFSGLLPIQQWYLEQGSSDISHFNQSVLLSIDKSITQNVLLEAVKQLSIFHDSLRFKYYKKDGKWRQEFTSNQAGLINEDLSKVEGPINSIIAEVANKYQLALDIEAGKLFLAVLIQTPNTEADNRLLMVIHHLAVDGVSWRILLTDLDLVISQLLDNQKVDLGSKTTSLRQWYNGLQQYGQNKQLLSQIGYWQNIVKSCEPITVDNSFEGEVLVKDVAHYQLRLAPEQTRSLLQQVPKVYHTEINDLLLAALAKTLCTWSATDKIVIGLEGHGREEIEEDLDISRTVGWFTNLYPVLLEVGSAANNDELIKTVKEQLRKVPGKGLGYGVLKYINKEETFQNRKSWDVVFNYLGQLDNISNESKWFKGAAEGAEASRSENLKVDEKLAIDSSVQAGELIFNWSYSKKHFNEDTIDRIASSYITNLTALISHCLTQEKSITTPSDYDLSAEVTHQELDKFLEENVQGRKRKEQIDGLYKLSGIQQGMLFHSLYNKEAGAYIEQLSCDLINPNIGLVKESWQSVVKRHSILRSAFYHDTFSIPVQCVYKEVEIPITAIDYSSMSLEEQVVAINKYKAADRSKGFDFKAAPIMRLALIRVSEDRYLMLWTSHHILFDGWSLPIIIEEFLQSYELLSDGKEVTIPEDDKFEDYIRFLDRKDKYQEETYWRNYLQDTVQSTMLPFISSTVDRNRGVGEFKTEYLKIDSETTSKVQAFAKRNRLTVSTIMQGVWSYLLHQYSGSNKITFGVTVSGRPDNLANIEQRVGMYINTLPLKSELKEDQSIVEWLQSLQQDQVSSRQYQYSSLHDVQNWTSVEGDLFDTTVTFQNYPINKVLTANDWKLKIENLSIHEQNNYPFSLTISTGEEISIRVIYNATLLQETYLREIENHFRNVLIQLVENSNATVSEIELLTAEEKQQLLVAFNNTATVTATNKTVVSLIEEQAVENANATALIFGEEQITYKELNERSNQLATYLRSQGVQTKTLVPICIEPGFEMMVGILAILKAGAAYVPIDPAYPLERVQFILEDTGATIVVSSKQSSNKIFGIRGLSIIKTDADVEAIRGQSTSNLNLDIAANHLAYIIYTSGSTGKPKGVMIEHSSLLNYLLNNKANYINKDSNNTGTFIHLSYTFDASVTGIFMPLLAGKSIVIGSEQQHEVFKDANLLKYAPFDFLKITPAHIELLKASMEDEDLRLVTKKLVLGGEALVPGHFDYFVENNIEVEIINEYGPTEATVGCSTYHFYPISEADKIKNGISIGKPLDNVQLYILNQSDQLLPVGVTGEICIGGAGLSRGYLNRPELTAEKFVQHPFIEGARIYKTGDLGRWLPDGSIEYQGRVDDQVKIRGYRVELGEVESAILQSGLVRQTVVIAKQDKEGNKRLVAYIVSDNPGNKEQVKNLLSEKLPEYMVPSLWIELEHLPLTSNGKIDKKALPEAGEHEEQTDQFIAPASDIELKLAEVWQDLLEVEDIGIHDDFFKLGGDSLLAIRVISAIRKKLGIEVDINLIFEYPTIAQLAKNIQGGKSATLLPTVASVQTRPSLIPVSYSQERLWFMDQLEGSVEYNTPAALRLIGQLNISALERSLSAIVDRHEVLRTVFREQGGQPYQFIKE
ncbi:non-ribosomal peptide synthetase, partial [Segetibacter sp.]|uniref:non-ribosomal peptide synthetase n=1 Tax=Segetibacter sp. TaxID=2231182 RepID=UPI00261C761B